jgi:ribonuclease G
MTRKRVREPLSKLLSERCDPCHGHGRIRTVATVAAEVLRRVVREAKARPGAKLVAYAAPEVTRWIEAQGDDMAAALRSRVPAGLRLEARPSFARAQFDVGVDQ